MYINITIITVTSITRIAVVFAIISSAAILIIISITISIIITITITITIIITIIIIVTINIRLAREACTVMTELETVVAKVSAGLSQLFACIILLFFDTEGFNMSTVGVVLPFASGAIRLFCKLKIVLQAGGAHKQVWHSRGDGSTKLCLCCSNLVSSSSGLEASDPTQQLKADIIQWRHLVLAKGADIRNSARYLASMAATMPLGAFDELQQALGLTHHLHGILLNTALDVVFEPVDVYCHDWMHCLFVDGVFNLVIVWLFEACIQSGMAQVYQVCSDYISEFV